MCCPRLRWRNRSRSSAFSPDGARRYCANAQGGPLFASLEPYRLWFTGLRREQAKTRANLQAVDTFTLPTGNHCRR